MPEQPQSLGAVLQRLVGHEQLTAADRDRAEAWIRDAGREPGTPWYLQPFIFLGALLAAGMISFGFASLFFNHWENTRMLTLGGVYLVGALVLRFTRINDFTDHLALSFSIGGHLFVFAALVDLRRLDHPEMVVFFSAVGLSAALYGLYSDFLHRFLSCLVVFMIAKFAFPAEELTDVLHGFVAAMAVVCAALLMRERQNPLWRPLAYACGYGLPLLLLPLTPRGLWFEDPELSHAWISSVVLGIGTLWALRFAATRFGVRASATQQALALLVVAGLCALATPGILAGLFLAVLGYATHHRQLVLVGLLALPVFVFKYYYNLELELMVKAGVLAGSGALLLSARWAMVRGRWFVEGVPRS